MKHISFPSIEQFRTVIKHVRDNAKYHNEPVPTLVFSGTVKLHGTNAGICRPVGGTINDIWVQSRERIIDPVQDNAGFAMWVHANKESLNKAFDFIEKHTTCNVGEVVQIFGEWCGGNIQKGVGITSLPKMFVIFDVRVSENAESEVWADIALEDLTMVVDLPNVYAVDAFTTWCVNIDFNNPEMIQNELIDITNKVEAECPVARTLESLKTVTGNTIGEGVVWTCVHRGRKLRFKVKGEKHSVSKGKTVAAVDVEKVASVNEFVDKVVTVNRLNQGIEKLKERGLEIESKNTGEFIKWIMADVLKEELDTLAASGLSTKDVTSKMASVARQFFMEVL